VVGGMLEDWMSNRCGQILNRIAALVTIASLLLTSRAAQALTCTPGMIDPVRSLIVTDAALDRSKFALRQTLDAILGGTKDAEERAVNRENFLKSLLVSFKDDVRENPDSKLPMPVYLRPFEAKLDPKKLLDPQQNNPLALVPVALVNRIDRAPNDWSNCGEYRIIYTFRRPLPETPDGPTGRFFLIFEAVVQNQSPKTGFEGCRAIANFWRRLSDEKDASKRAKHLARFYYSGIAGTGGPVVQAKNYGAPLGQVRGNFFSTLPDAKSSSWHLRQWIVVNADPPKTLASFKSVPVQNTPLAEFYIDESGTSSDQSPNASLEAERAKFHEAFLNTLVSELFQPDIDRKKLTSGDPRYKAELDPRSDKFNKEKYKVDILNRIGVQIDNRFSEFQSVSDGTESDGTEDNPEAIAGEKLREKIGIKSSQLEIDTMQMPDITDVLNRAGAVTCGGCHNFATSRSVGKIRDEPILWPKSAVGRFVHVTEEEGFSKEQHLSPALREVFLPFRKEQLANAICIPKAKKTVSHPIAQRALDAARQARWKDLLTASRAATDEAARQALIQLAIQVIMVQRHEESQKPGFFVINRRAH
jgi:hypothetical protein